MSNAYDLAALGFTTPVQPIAVATEGFIKGEYVIPVVSVPMPVPQVASMPRGAPGRAIDAVPGDYWLWLLLAAASSTMVHVETPEAAKRELPSEDLIERLRRLVALSGSDNEYEATSAAKQVARLLREENVVEDLVAYLRMPQSPDVPAQDKAVTSVLHALIAASIDSSTAPTAVDVENAIATSSPETKDALAGTTVRTIASLRLRESIAFMPAVAPRIPFVRAVAAAAVVVSVVLVLSA